MAVCVCMGASMMCSFGTTPSTLIVNSQQTTMTGTLAATIMDNKPVANMPPFGMCNNVINPATKRPPPVLFTPAPCVPNTPAPWIPGSPTVLIGGKPALNNTCKLMCAWGGVIQIEAISETRD